MKRIFFTLVIFSLALLLGCQEKLINEPEFTSLEKRSESVTKNALKICCEMQDPFYQICRLNGCVYYSNQIMAISMNPIGNRTYELALHLEINLDLCDLLGMVHLPWEVKGCCDESVCINEGEEVILQRYYEISNRSDVLLCVNYIVTLEGIVIGKTWLEQIY